MLKKWNLILNLKTGCVRKQGRISIVNLTCRIHLEPEYGELNICCSDCSWEGQLREDWEYFEAGRRHELSKNAVSLKIPNKNRKDI